jgi:dienelactone hydrolase
MSEHLTQKAFFDWVQYQRFPGIDLMHAVPNGGQRHKAVAAKLKAEGVKPGVPDVFWPVVRGGFIGLAIEFKHGDGNPTKEQRTRIDALQREGWLVAVCWSWEAAARLVKGYAGMLHVGIAP